MQLFQTIESKLVVITKSCNPSEFKSNQELQNVSIFLFLLEHHDITCTILYKTMQCKNNDDKSHEIHRGSITTKPCKAKKRQVP
jgi:hypothetical protein